MRRRFRGLVRVFLGGRWHIFDARNNIPRIGRVLMARRDATMCRSATFGQTSEELQGLDR